jgi:hypothetical protein
VNDASTIQNGDSWLSDNLEAYRQWATTHNSLLITVWDENDYDFTNANDIPMIVDGDPHLVQPGVNSDFANHFDLLRTLETDYGLAPTGRAATANGLSENTAGQLVPDITNLANFSSFTRPIDVDLLAHTVDDGVDPTTTLQPGTNAITGTRKADVFMAAPGAGAWTIKGGGGKDVLSIDLNHDQAVAAFDGKKGTVVTLDGSVLHTSGLDHINFLDGTVDLKAGSDYLGFHPLT